MATVVLSHVKKQFPKAQTPAVKDVNLEIQRGSLLFL